MLPLASVNNSIGEISFNSKNLMIDYNCYSFF
jgi:hypothetical protein